MLPSMCAIQFRRARFFSSDGTLLNSALLRLLLAFDAVGRPGQCFEPFEADRSSARSANAKITRVNTFQGGLNSAQSRPVLAVGCKHGFLGRLDAGTIYYIAGFEISECENFFVDLVNCTRQFALLFLQTNPEQQKRFIGKRGL